MRHSIAALTLVAGLATPFLWTALGTIAHQDEGDDDEIIGGGPLSYDDIEDRRREEMQQLMEGMWVLRTLSSSSERLPDEQFHGFACIVDGYISVVIHALAYYEGVTEPIPELLFQANMSQFELREEGSMYAATLIGHSNLAGNIQTEPVHDVRLYYVEVDEYDLVLTSPRNIQLQFRRLQPGAFPQGAEGRIRGLQTGF